MILTSIQVPVSVRRKTRWGHCGAISETQISNRCHLEQQVWEEKVVSHLNVTRIVRFTELKLSYIASALSVPG